jgi:hypothetical protein
MEQLARHFVDLAPPRAGLDHLGSYLTIVRSLAHRRPRCQIDTFVARCCNIPVCRSASK